MRLVARTDSYEVTQSHMLPSNINQPVAMAADYEEFPVAAYAYGRWLQGASLSFVLVEVWTRMMNLQFFAPVLRTNGF